MHWRIKALWAKLSSMGKARGQFSIRTRAVMALAARCAELYGWVIVNTDSVRIATHGHRFWREAESLVWATTEIMVRSLFITGHSVVVLDATNVQRTLRDKWARLGRWETWYRQFDVSATTCMKRASGDEVLLEVIESMSARYNRLSGEELDRLVILPGE